MDDAADSFPLRSSAASETIEKIRRFAWGSTPLGQIDAWPPSLRSAVDTILRSPLPMALLWGETFVQIYNDAYGRLLGPEKAGAFGASVPTQERTRLGHVSRGEEAEVWVRTIDGKPVAHLLSPVIDDEGDVAVLAIVLPSLEQTDGARIDLQARKSEDPVDVATALRDSEDRFRGLVESIDEGFCIVEMIVDDAGRPTDYRFLETNAAFSGGVAAAESAYSLAVLYDSGYPSSQTPAAREALAGKYYQASEALGLAWQRIGEELYTNGKGACLMLFDCSRQRRKKTRARLIGRPEFYTPILL